MKTIQLRQYSIVPGHYEDFLAWWTAELVPLRHNFGFTIESAYGSAKENIFVWAVSLPGDQKDFEAINARYSESPERAKVFDDLPKRVANMDLSFVEEHI